MTHDYEVRFRGEAGATVRAAFPEFGVSTAEGETILRGPIRDQAALHEVLGRLLHLGLELTDVHVLDDTSS